MARSRAPRRPLWLITNHENGRMGVLTLDPGSETEALPVFSFEEEAEMFLRLGTPGPGWRTRKATTGEFVSLLYGLCAGVKRVTLDPLPVVDGKMVFDLVDSGREDFLRNFVDGPPSPLSRLQVEVTTGLELAKHDPGGEPKRSENGTTWRKLTSTRDRASDEAEDAAIPDYAMREFEPSERSRESADGHQANGHHPASGASDAGKDLVRVRVASDRE